jgi:hypothetical protein
MSYIAFSYWTRFAARFLRTPCPGRRSWAHPLVGLFFGLGGAYRSQSARPAWQQTGTNWSNPEGASSPSGLLRISPRSTAEPSHTSYASASAHVGAGLADHDGGTWAASGRPPDLAPRRGATRSSYGSVAWSLCTTTHPLYTRFNNIIGTSLSEATMRPNPRSSTG